MHSAYRLMGVGLAGVVLAACGGDGSGDHGAPASAGRLDALEKRIAAIERAVEPLDRLRDDQASLDRRLSSLEASIRDVAARRSGGATPPPTAGAPVTGGMPPRPAPSRGPAAWNGPTTRTDRTERRAELRALSDEFRSRLSELRKQPNGTQDSEKTREILDWYREQRRSILRGEGRTDE
jgi:hypothetical protein